MDEEPIRYDRWIEEALRGVIRRALDYVAEHGLPGEHHYYITFRTDADGVEAAPRLLEQHPDEMTIVLQHQFWDLGVDDEAFEVTLKFLGRRERLRVPLSAITAFADPSVNFGLQLKMVSTQPGSADAESDDTDAEGGRSDSGGGETGEVIALDTFRKK